MRPDPFGRLTARLQLIGWILILPLYVIIKLGIIPLLKRQKKKE